MREAVSISLGSRSRDRERTIDLGGIPVRLRREGTDGNLAEARRRFAELDGRVDALGLGGFELYIRVGSRHYPMHRGLGLIRDVRSTPVVDGGGLKQTLERRVFERATGLAGARFRKALVLLGIDRFGLSQAVSEVAETVEFADFHYGLGLPITLRSTRALAAAARWILPVAGRLPIRMLYPIGPLQKQNRPRFGRLWRDIDLVAGDFHYIRRNMPPRIDGVTVVTNTTTEEDVELLQARGARRLVVTTPRMDGRSFGTNLLEAALVAREGRLLSAAELDERVIRLDLRPQEVDFSD